MKFTKLFGVGMLAFSMLAWNAYGVDQDSVKTKVKAVRGMDTDPPEVPGTFTPAPFGDDCGSAGSVGPLASTGGTLDGDTSAATDGFSSAGSGWDAAADGCSAGAGSEDGADLVLEFTVDATGLWDFTTCPGYSNPGTGGPAGGSGFDTSLQVFDGSGGCIGSIIDCSQDGGGNCPGFESELIGLSLTAGTTYYMLVDSWSAGSFGPFSVAYQGPCTSDQECTDRDQDVFCNGAETCNAGVCESAGDPCAGTGEPVCDEAARVCLACSAAADPDGACGNDGDACNGIETCDLATGGCFSSTACPDGLCNNGTCQTTGACATTLEPCRQDEDCPFFSQGQPCLLDGTGSLTDCWDGSSSLGPNQDCGAGESCVPNAADTFTCERDSCNVYLTDNSGYFGPGQGFETWAADEFTLAAAPAGRDVVSYQMQVLCRRQRPAPCTGVGPFNMTMELWSATDTDPLVDPNAGLPDALIPGTQCVFANTPCGVGGPVGTPGRTATNVLVCNATGGTLLDNVAAGIDDWILYNADTACQGFSIGGGPPLSRGTILGASGFDFFGDSNGLPAGNAGVGWSLGFFGGAPFDSNFGNANVCTDVVGPCCVGVAGCEMLSDADCTAQGGSWVGPNDTLNPITCADTGDSDGVADLCDNCPDVNNIDQADCNDDGEGDACEADEAEQDRDFDGECNGTDGCPDDPGKIDPLQCGCGNSEDDADGDGTADCNDNCPNDPGKVDPGTCGCGTADVGDEDGDGVLDCVDQCRGVDDAIFAPECDGAIPTVSEWGLVILALLLLVAGKVYFGRQRAMV